MICRNQGRGFYAIGARDTIDGVATVYDVRANLGQHERAACD